MFLSHSWHSTHMHTKYSYLCATCTCKLFFSQSYVLISWTQKYFGFIIQKWALIETYSKSGFPAIVDKESYNLFFKRTSAFRAIVCRSLKPGVEPAKYKTFLSLYSDGVLNSDKPVSSFAVTSYFISLHPKFWPQTRSNQPHQRSNSWQFASPLSFGYHIRGEP